MSGTQRLFLPSSGQAFLEDLSLIQKKNLDVINVLKGQKIDDVQELLQTASKVHTTIDRVLQRAGNASAQQVLISPQSSHLHDVVGKLQHIVGEYITLLNDAMVKDQLAKQLSSTRARKKFEQLCSSLLTETTILDELSDDLLKEHDKNYQKLPVFENAEEKVEILDPDGFELWVDVVGNETNITADVSKVVKALIQRLGVNLSTSERKIVIQVLDPSHTGQISSLRWNEFLKGFGPLAKCLYNLQEMLAKPWFHGFLSRDDATKLLEVEPKGTFMVRFSSTKPGSFSLAHTMDNLVVNHVIVHTRDNGFAIREDSSKEKLFPTVSHLIEAYSAILIKPYSQRFPRELWWHGDLSAEEAQELLKDKKPGTFLIRFSSTQRGCFASSFVDTKTGLIEKGLIIGSQYGYQLSGKVFASMEEIIESLIRWGIFTEPYKNTTNEVNDKMRYKIVSEIVETERTYVKSLEYITNIFIPEFKANPKICSPQDCQVIWCNSESIYSVHRQFLLTLERTVAFWDPDDTAIGVHFLQVKAQLPPLYSLYVNNCQEASQTLDKIASTKEGQQFIAKVLDKQPNEPKVRQNTLNSFIILPVQRVPRYILLLNDLIKHTNGAHSDYDDLVDAAAAVKEVAQSVNESKRVVENAEEIKKMQTKIEGLEGESLALLGRSFVKEGKLTSLEADNKDGYCFLFSDLLLVTKKKSATKFKLRHRIDLRGAQVVSVPDDKGNKNMFRIVCGTEITMIADTPEEKSEWITIMKEVLIKLAPKQDRMLSERTASVRRPSAMP